MNNIKIDDFTKYKFLSGVKHSPDGKYACYVVHETDLEENKYLSNLWILDNYKKDSYRLTSFDNERSFLWLDNENIIFPAVRDVKDKDKKDSGEEFTQYYKINIHGGEAVKYLRIPRNINSLKIIDKDTFIFTSEYNFNQRELSLLNEEEKAEELKARKEEKDYEVLEEIPFWSNGGGFISKKRNRLYIYHASSKEVEAVTEENFNVDAFNLNGDKTKAVIIGYSIEHKMPLFNDVFVYYIESRRLEKLNKEEMSHYFADFIENNKIIFTASAMKDYGINENEKFYTMDLDLKETSCITPGLDAAITNSVGSDCRFGGSDLKQIDNNYLYFVTTEGESSFLNRIDESGSIEKLVADEGSVDGISISNGHMLYVAMRKSTLQELYSKEDDIEQQATDFNGWIYEELKVGQPEKITVETEPGVLIDGWLLKPADFDENKKYPAILDIHGGPKTVYGTVFVHEMQYWANEGYAVFFCNPRGSDGKGNEFADIRGKYGTIDYDDIMKFTDEVLRRYSFIDSERIGVTGGSYGGFMTNWIIGHTDRFKAAASQRSISNWISMYSTTDIGYFFAEDQVSATPWSNQEKLWDNSPLKYADKVKTPTLFLHSEEDYRCWLVEGIQMFTALKYHGVEARMCMFRGENHELSRSGKPKHRVRRLKEITQWFDKYLK